MKKRLITLAAMIARKIPKAYRPSITRPACLGKKAPAMRMYTGILPAHDIRGIISIVMMRLFLFSMVLVAITAGTLQPKPMTIGMKDFPWRPILCISLSMMKAPRAIYPVSSRREMNRYRRRIFGRKTSTLPTPPMIPFTTRSLNQPSCINDAVTELKTETIHSIHLIGYSPSTKVPLNTRYSMTKNNGKAAHLLVTTASIFSVIVVLRLFPWYGFHVSARAPCTKAYRASIMADSTLELNISLILFCCWKRAEMISSRFGRASITPSTSLSFSRYLMER